MSADIDATPDLLLLIQQKLHIVRYRYGLTGQFVDKATHGQSSRGLDNSQISKLANREFF